MDGGERGEGGAGLAWLSDGRIEGEVMGVGRGLVQGVEEFMGDACDMEVQLGGCRGDRARRKGRKFLKEDKCRWNISSI